LRSFFTHLDAEHTKSITLFNKHVSVVKDYKTNPSFYRWCIRKKFSSYIQGNSVHKLI